ncbi:hypothetical protein [Sabulicella rubraurantiaca]|uniref:hypothetical protein n=1 Tax=Sabulicella rubraurantiaca TaxID=2811429 RepID=UPI001A95C2C6|nr:hypothetical protein [Sabulicella rubraurantiaca]
MQRFGLALTLSGLVLVLGVVLMVLSGGANVLRASAFLPAALVASGGSLLVLGMVLLERGRASEVARIHA